MPVGKRVAELSLAQRHVVEIARALATNPQVLFLDEPTEPLQLGDVRKLFDLIDELKRDGVGIVYVSHRLHEVDELADRISVMRDGEIIDSRLAKSITPAEIVALIAGRPLGQIFPAKATMVGAPLFAVSGLSGRGFDQVDLVVHAGEIVGLPASKAKASANSFAPPPAWTVVTAAKCASSTTRSPATVPMYFAAPASVLFRTIATPRACSST